MHQCFTILNKEKETASFRSVKRLEDAVKKGEKVMTVRERLRNTLNFKPVDQLPQIEWAGWWDKTIENWRTEGLSKELDWEQIKGYWNLDGLCQIWIAPRSRQCPTPQYHGAGIMETPEDYERLRPFLFPKEEIEKSVETLKKWKPLHDRGDISVWVSFDGFFWFPRTLFGIQNHLYAFYDYPELMHQMNQDETDFILTCLDEICKVLTPDFMTIAEDMSYNHGPMLSKACFDEFLKPYYQQVVPVIREKGIIPFVDTDGDVMPMIPWLREVGIQGVLPLERQAGVDVAEIRKKYPDFRMIGAYDKTVMHKGEAAMRAEFERLLPVMRTGGFIPSVDHQTPPDVSMENYAVYRKLLEEYSSKGAAK